MPFARDTHTHTHIHYSRKFRRAAASLYPIHVQFRSYRKYVYARACVRKTRDKTRARFFDIFKEKLRAGLYVAAMKANPLITDEEEKEEEI